MTTNPTTGYFPTCESCAPDFTEDMIRADAMRRVLIRLDFIRLDLEAVKHWAERAAKEHYVDREASVIEAQLATMKTLFSNALDVTEKRMVR